MLRTFTLFFTLTPLFAYAQKFDEIKFAHKPEDLGGAINTEMMEGEPKISPDGKVLYFCRRSDPLNIGGAETGADIWFSVKNEKGEWEMAENLGRPVNNRHFNQVVAIRTDGEAMLVKGVMNRQAMHDLYYTERFEDGWRKPLPLKIRGITKKLNNATYTASTDFSILIIATNKFKGYGKDDLFVSFRETDSYYSAPVNLGPVINTEKDEVFPVLAADGKTLFFSSNGHQGYGDYDVFVSTRTSSDWQKWSKPTNMGNVINSKRYEADFTVDPKADFAYISSDKDRSYGFDIYRVKLPEEAKPKPVVLITGSIFDSIPTEPVRINITYFDKITKEKLGQTIYESTDGSYKVILPYGTIYDVLIEADGFMAEREIIDLRAFETYKEIRKDFMLIKNEPEIVVKTKKEVKVLTKGISEEQLDTLVAQLVEDPMADLSKMIAQVELVSKISFEFGESVLNPDDFPEIDNVIKIMLEQPSLFVQIAGHTDNIGSAQGNLRMSELRAREVANYVISKGIDKERVLAVGFGESQPVASNKTGEGRYFNRRVTFKIRTSAFSAN